MSESAVTSAMLRIRFSASWLVWMASQWPPKCGSKRRTAHTIASHLRWVLSYCFPASLRERDQYQIELVVSCGSFRSKIQSIWTLHAAVSSFMCPPEWASAKSSGDINVFLSVSMAWISSLFSRKDETNLSFFKRWLSGIAIRAKLGTNFQKILHKPRAERSSLRLVGGWSPRMATVLGEASCKGLGWIRWPK